MSNLPNLEILPPTTKRYLVDLGLHRIPINTWSSNKNMRDITSLTQETTENRLRKSRFVRIIQKLQDCHIYMMVEDTKIYASFNVPLTIEDESPGLDATVRLSFHPEGFVGNKTVSQAPSSVAPRSKQDLCGEEENLSPSVARISEAITETQKTIQTVGQNASPSNLQSLLNRLIKLDRLFIQLKGEIDQTIKEVQSVLAAPLEQNSNGTVEAISVPVSASGGEDTAPSGEDTDERVDFTESNEYHLEVDESEDEDEINADAPDGRDLGVMKELFKDLNTEDTDDI